MIPSEKLATLIFVLPDYFFNISLNLPAGSHYFMPAPTAFYFQIHSHPKHVKFLATTGMGFFHFQNVADLNVHFIVPPIG